MTRILIALLVSFVFAAASAQAQPAKEAPSFDENLSTYQYPYPVAFFDFKSQGQDLRMAYMYLPAKDAAKPVVTLLHGKNFNGAYWQETAAFLQTLGYGVLMPDQIGFGKSTKEDDYQYSFAALANNTHQLLQKLEIKNSIIVGHSMGGMLASRFALLYPEATRKLILVNPIGLENYLQFVQYKDVGFFYQDELKKTPEAIIAYQKSDYYDGVWNDKYEALTLPLTGWLNGKDWQDLAYVNALTTDMIFTQPVIEEFKDFAMPVTLIMGTRDRTALGKPFQKPENKRELGRYDRLGAEVKARNRSIDVIELEGLGHLPQIEDFERFKQAFEPALAKSSTIEVSKTLGGMQCQGNGKDISELRQELTSQNIPVIAADCGSDGMMYIAVCGAPDGSIGIFTIDAQHREKAALLGFLPLAEQATKHSCLTRD